MNNDPLYRWHATANRSFLYFVNVEFRVAPASCYIREEAGAEMGKAANAVFAGGNTAETFPPGKTNKSQEQYFFCNKIILQS